MEIALFFLMIAVATLVMWIFQERFLIHRPIDKFEIWFIGCLTLIIIVSLGVIFPPSLLVDDYWSFSINYIQTC